MRVISNEECSKNIDYVTENHFCAVLETPGSGIICNGDSGGAFSKYQNFERKILGVVSYGLDGCEKTSLTVFTRVSNYLSWILKIIY